VKIAHQGDTPAILLYDAKDAKDPFQVSFYFLFVNFFYFTNMRRRFIQDSSVGGEQYTAYKTVYLELVT
jgi:hypothetical protein